MTEPIRPRSLTGRGVHWPDVVAQIRADGGPINPHPDGARVRTEQTDNTPPEEAA